MASALDLKLDDEDMTRLRPIVEDLLAVGQKLRRTYAGGIGPSGHSERSTQQPE